MWYSGLTHENKPSNSTGPSWALQMSSLNVYSPPPPQFNELAHSQGWPGPSDDNYVLIPASNEHKEGDKSNVDSALCIWQMWGTFHLVCTYIQTNLYKFSLHFVPSSWPPQSLAPRTFLWSTGPRRTTAKSKSFGKTIDWTMATFQLQYKTDEIFIFRNKINQMNFNQCPYPNFYFSCSWVWWNYFCFPP